MKLSFSWWNTSLSPVGRRRATDNQKRIAYSVISYLTSQAGVDFLGLGEVSIADVAEIFEAIGLENYDFIDGTLKQGRLQFDTGLLYRKDKIKFAYSESIVTARGSHKLKVANRNDFYIPYTEKPFHIFVTHWPSRLWCEKNGADRQLLGVRLRDAIEDLNKYYGSPANTIIFGDFNDEPFDSSLSEQLLASRDRNLIRKKPYLLYNPFWRHLGESTPQDLNGSCMSYSGSYFYSGGVETEWRTFDQIIFSSSFLGGSEWFLNEKHTKILQLQPFDSIICKSDEIFDHFPIIGTIEREEKIG